MIVVTYTSVDRVRIVKRTKYLELAQEFAHNWVGRTPEIGSTYAISGDGVGKIEVEGATLKDLFPDA